MKPLLSRSFRHFTFFLLFSMCLVRETFKYCSLIWILQSSCQDIFGTWGYTYSVCLCVQLKDTLCIYWQFKKKKRIREVNYIRKITINNILYLKQNLMIKWRLIVLFINFPQNFDESPKMLNGFLFSILFTSRVTIISSCIIICEWQILQ